MRVLLIVDMQRDFCPGGSFAVTDGDKIIPAINRLMAEGGYDLIVASKDFHPAGNLSFASSHPGKVPFDTVIINGKEQTVWVDHCVQNTLGCEFHPNLDVGKIDKVILKGTEHAVDSLSAFRDNEQNRLTELFGFLKQEARKRGEEVGDITVDVCGLALEYCCRFSAEDARDLGMNVRFIVDATKAVDQRPESIEQNLVKMRAKNIQIVEVKNLIPEVRKLQANDFLPQTATARSRGIELGGQL